MTILSALVLAGIFVLSPQNPEHTTQPLTQNTKDYIVTKVTDGDTIHVSKNEAETVIRMIGINAPESNGPYRDRECYGPEASDQLKELLPLGSVVIIETDPSQDLYDRYDRLLGYVILGEVNINEAMIKLGAAKEYTYDKPYRYQQNFRSAEREAEIEGLGLWSVCE